MNPKGPYTRQEKKSFHDASNYFKEKLNENPNNMRYNYFQASLQQALGDAASSNYHYQEAMNIAPDNVFIRNDFAVHLANQKRYDDAALELNRALLIQPDKSILHKNLSAIQCRTGKYNEAVAPALRVLQLDPEDDMGHRNMALIREALGDSKSALDHNLTSIMLQQKNRQPPNPKAFRAAAGGNLGQAQALIDTARQIEGKKFETVTFTRTCEIISRINRLKGDKLKQLKDDDEVEQERMTKKEMLRKGIMPKSISK